MITVRQNEPFTATVRMQASDGAGVAGIAGSLVIEAKKSEGAFAVISPTITDRGDGWYDLDLTASHLDTLGLMVFHITGPGVVANDALQLNVTDVVGEDVVTSLSTTSTSLTSTTTTVDTISTDVDTLNTDVSAVNTSVLAVGTQVDGVSTAVAGVRTSLSTTTSSVSSVGTQVTDVGTQVTSVSDAMASMSVTINTVADDVSALTAAVLALPTDILGQLMSDHSIAGSFGEGLAIGAGLLQGNYLMDNVVMSANGPTSARLRLFRSGAATAAATTGGVDEGEFATFVVTTTYAGPRKIATHKVVRQ